MKFSLLLICFSSLEAEQSLYTVSEDKPFMYFDGKEWRERKSLPDRYSNINNANESSIKLINFNETIEKPTSLNNTKNNEIHKRASENESAKVQNYSRPDIKMIESESHIILNQTLNFIEKRYNSTKDTYASASLSTNPEAWIKLVLELSNALKEIAVRANESYYTLIQQPTPSFLIKTWRKSNVNQRENEGLDGLLGILSEVTPNELPEDLDRKNEIYMNEEFPLQLNIRHNVDSFLDQGIEEENNRYVYFDTQSGDVVSDGIEEVRVLKKRK